MTTEQAAGMYAKIIRDGSYILEDEYYAYLFGVNSSEITEFREIMGGRFKFTPAVIKLNGYIVDEKPRVNLKEMKASLFSMSDDELAEVAEFIDNLKLE